METIGKKLTKFSVSRVTVMSVTKTIVLTGVSRGLGSALVREFVAAGHVVIGCARSSAAVAELADTYPGEHRFDVLDLGVEQQIKEWSDAVLREYDAPDFLINNAATINRNAPLWEVPHDEVSQVMAINVTAVASVIRHFVPSMIERKQGVIVNLSSGWGRSVSPDVAPYCASKWAIEGMTRALAAELPAGLAAIPLNPGIINTDMLQSCFGPSADNQINPASWAKKAAPYILNLTTADNGQPLTAP